MFHRDDWTLFRNLNTLGQRAGVSKHDIPRLVAKELVDNAYDAGQPTGALKVTQPDGFVVPGEAELLEVIQKSIAACRSQGLFPDPPVTTLTTRVALKEKGSETSDKEPVEAEADGDEA
jgi:hypothetical protein